MAQPASVLAPLSASTTSVRRLSQHATDQLLEQVIARVIADPARLGAVLAEYPDPLLSFTPDRQIVRVNRAAEQLFCARSGELAGSTDLLMPARLRQPNPAPIQSAAAFTTIELPGLRRDGRETQLSWTFGAVNDHLFVAVLRDRAEIEDALDASYAREQRFRILVEGLRDHAVFMIGPDGVITTWNSGAERMKGWSADEVIGRPHDMFYTPEDRSDEQPARDLAAALEHGQVHATGWRLRADGSRFYAEVSLRPLFASDGELHGFANITHDLTAQRAAEEAERGLAVERAARHAAEANRDQLARLHRAARALSGATTPDEVVEVVLDQCLAEVSASAGMVMQLEPDGQALTMLGQHGHPPELVSVYARLPLSQHTASTEAVRTRQAQFYESAAIGGTRYPAIIRAIRQGGFEASAALPLIAHGIVLGALVIRYREQRSFGEAERALLLTMAELCAQALERAHLFEAQLEARAQAEAASRAKDEFLAMLGHELRNPLAPIATAIELMKLRGETHSLREREVIERQLGHISHLVDDLLDISRITRGKLELALRAIDVADVVGRAVEMASPLLEARHHALGLDVERGLTVDADAARLAQVISNLLSNAAKYTPPNGEIDVEVKRRGAQAVITVRDNGQGIGPELLPRVFDLFTQGKRTFDRSEGGLGIGLALVKNLVGLHGGTVGVTSTPGRGSEFTVRLPLHVRVSDEPATSPPAIGAEKQAKRILLVDDNRDFAEMLAQALTTLGYEVATAADGISALDRLRDFPAQIAVLDLGLPVLDGFELARKIREEFPGRVPRMIAVTGYGQQHDRERTANLGFAAHLVKPIDLKAMIAALDG